MLACFDLVKSQSHLHLAAEPEVEVAVGCHGSQIEKVSDFAFFDSGNLPKYNDLVP